MLHIWLGENLGSMVSALVIKQTTSSQRRFKCRPKESLTGPALVFPTLSTPL